MDLALGMTKWVEYNRIPLYSKMGPEMCVFLFRIIKLNIYVGPPRLEREFTSDGLP